MLARPLTPVPRPERPVAVFPLLLLGLALALALAVTVEVEVEDVVEALLPLPTYLRWLVVVVGEEGDDEDVVSG